MSVGANYDHNFGDGNGPANDRQTLIHRVQSKTGGAIKLKDL
jgi:hypothetical protein